MESEESYASVDSMQDYRGCHASFHLAASCLAQISDKSDTGTPQSEVLKETIPTRIEKIELNKSIAEYAESPLKSPCFGTVLFRKAEILVRLGSHKSEEVCQPGTA